MAITQPSHAVPSSRPSLRDALRRGAAGAAIVVALVAIYLNSAGYATDVPAEAPAAAASPMRLLPSRLGALDLAWSLTGAEALRQVAGLHVGRFPLATAEVAGYGPDTTVWVAIPAGTTPAHALVTEMTEAIAKGGSPFDTPAPLEGRPGVWQTTGAGQQHLFFARNGAVWWLAADETAAPDALAALLSEVGR